jgi:hypothetical protein
MSSRSVRSVVVSTVTIVLLVAAVSGCASSAPPPPPPRPSTTVPLDGLRRIVVVGSPGSRFAAAAQTSSASADQARILDEVLKWIPYKDVIGPIARILHQGITWLMDSERASTTAPREVSPAVVVAKAFAETLLASGPSPHILVTDREPVGEARREADAIVRVTVPSWGVVRVQEGTPPLVGAFADVRAEMVVRDTGVVVWLHDEDVTHPERVPAEVFTRDRAAARERLTEVLERAGRRLAHELVYAQGGP